MKKAFLAFALIATLLTNVTSTSYAHNENESQQGDRNQGGGDQQQQSTAMITEADVSITHDSASSSVTMTFADGTPFANCAVTVKNSTPGQEGDIEQNQAADENGVFNYSKWIDAGVAILRITVPQNDIGSGTIEYNIESETMTIEAGRNRGDGSGGGGNQPQANSSSTYMIAGCVVAVVAVGAGVAVAMQKKKKVAFEAANAKGRGKKKGSSK